MPTKETKLDSRDEKKIQLAVEKAKIDIIEEKERDSSIKEYYETEGKKRYRCIVTSTRKMEKQFEMCVENPSNPSKAVTIKGKIGVVLEEGLPEYAIQRLEAAYDYSSEDTSGSVDPNADMGVTFVKGKMPRYTVKRLGLVENPKILGTKVRVKSA